jgi:prepilin-type N-terminal cleavage/methylation domain-containing protein
MPQQFTVSALRRPSRRPLASRAAGFTLVEVCVAVVILSLLLVALLQTGMVRMTAGELRARKQDSRAVADNALAALAAASRQLLPDGGGTFTLSADNTLNITGDCAPSLCDYVLEPEAPSALKTSLARGVPWVKGYTPPAGYAVKFMRRWRTDAVSAPAGVAAPPSRSLTLVVTLNEDAKLPLTVARTIVAPRF